MKNKNNIFIIKKMFSRIFGFYIRDCIKYAKLFLNCLIIPLLLLSCGEKKESINPNLVSRPVKTIMITDKPYELSYNFPGKVRADRKTILSFQVRGRIVKLPVKVGQTVKKGDLLAQLDPQNYKHLYLNCVAAYNEKKVKYRRAKALHRQDVISVGEYDTRVRQYEESISNLKIAKKKYNDTALYAAYSGIVAKKFVENYQEIQAKQPIFMFFNLKFLEIEMYLPEKYMILFENPKKYNCFANFLPFPDKKFKLKLKEYDAIADPQTLAYKIIFRMKNPEELRVFPGMSARVEMVKNVQYSDDDKYSYQVPVEAVVSNIDKSSFVWLVDKKTNAVYKQNVVVDEMRNDLIMINKGLKVGDRLVVSGVHHLHVGLKVHEYSHGKGR
jgi:RND family efflux transporter MFP subunit